MVAYAAIARTRSLIEGESISPELEAAEAAMLRCWNAPRAGGSLQSADALTWLLRAMLTAGQGEAAERLTRMAANLEAERDPAASFAWACIHEYDTERLLDVSMQIQDRLTRARILVEGLRQALRRSGGPTAGRLAQAAARSIDETYALDEREGERLHDLIRAVGLVRQRHTEDGAGSPAWLAPLRAALFNAAARLSTVRDYAIVFPATMQVL